MTKEKESGLTKLIELLNEFGEYDLVEHNGEICKWDTDDEGEINIYTDYTNNIISKKYGFIKWLVENDKIDREQKTKEFRLQIELDNGSYGELGGEARLLMILSISDTPIEDLISYLK